MSKDKLVQPESNSSPLAQEKNSVSGADQSNAETGQAKTASSQQVCKTGQTEQTRLQGADSAAPQKPGPSAQAVKGPSEVSNVIGAYQILPGESAQKYHHGLAATIEELGAKTMMQIYIAEKIFQCLWWMRRYETQKRSSIIKEMVKALADFASHHELKRKITKLLEAGQWSDATLQTLMDRKGHTAGSLLELAMDKQKEELIQLDQSIHLKTSTLMQLQKSYEVLVNRSVLQERLNLQNELLKRDLRAIDIPTIKRSDNSLTLADH
jgi:hypothetical protein